MLKEEVSYPMYLFKPTISFHAPDDRSAADRARLIESVLGYIMSGTDPATIPARIANITTFTYSEIEMEPGHLIMSGWPDEEDRVVR